MKMVLKNSKCGGSARSKKKKLFVKLLEETIIDIYEKIPHKATGGDCEDGLYEEAEQEAVPRAPVSFNIGWLLDQMPENAKRRLDASLNPNIREIECPHTECKYWGWNYCATTGQHKNCEDYLKSYSKRTRNYHKKRFFVGVEISATNIRK